MFVRGQCGSIIIQVLRLKHALIFFHQILFVDIKLSVYTLKYLLIPSSSPFLYGDFIVKDESRTPQSLKKIKLKKCSTKLIQELDSLETQTQGRDFMLKTVKGPFGLDNSV